MSKWITGEDVARRLKLRDFEIFDLLAAGKLQPYSSITGKKMKWFDFNRLDHVEALNQKHYFNGSLFLKSDIDAFVSAQTEKNISTNKQNIPEPLSTNTRGTKTKPEAEYSIKRNGYFWTIRFQGKESKSIKDVVGLRYIAYLLERPATGVNSMTLYRAINGNMPDVKLNISSAIDDGLNVGNSKKHEINDYKAKLCYTKETEKLWQEYEGLDDTPENAIIKNEILQKIELLKKGSNERAFSNDVSKKQTLIRGILKTAYKNIRTDPSMKKCADHLEKEIKTDGALGYIYNGEIKWEIFL